MATWPKVKKSRLRREADTVLLESTDVEASSVSTATPALLLPACHKALSPDRRKQDLIRKQVLTFHRNR